MEFEQIFLIIWFIITFTILTIFYTKGKDALSIYPALDNITILYREKGVSGYSRKSFFTKIGGAKNILDVIITRDEFWIKAPILFAHIGQMNDLLHKVRLNDILSVKEEGRNLELIFKNKGFTQSHLVLRMKNRKEFINIIQSITPNLK